MATVPPFFYTGPTATQAPMPEESPQDAAAPQMAAAQGLSQLSNTFASMGDMLNQRATRDQIRYQNEEYAAQSAKLTADRFLATPDITNMINNGVSDEEIKLAKLNEAKRLEALPAMNEQFVATGSIKAQEGWLDAMPQFQKQAGPNGEGYLENINKYFNNASLQAQHGAPSQIAAVRLIDRIQQYKLQAIAGGVVFEAQKRSENLLNLSNESADSLTKQAIMVPENYSTYLDQAKAFKDTLIQGGMDADKAQKWLDGAQSKITTGYIYRKTLDNPHEALALLGDPNVSQYMSASDFVSSSNHAMEKAKGYDEMQFKLQEQQHAQARMASGVPLNENDPEDKKILESDYATWTGGLRDPSTGAFNKDPVETAQTLYQILQRSPTLLPDKFKSDYQNAVMYGGSKQVEAFARLTGRMQTDPNLSPLLAKMDKGSVSEALYVNNSLNAGATIDDAVQNARTTLRKAPIDGNSERSKMADTLLTPANIQSSLKGVFASWLAPLSGAYSAITGGSYDTQGGKFWNPPNLIDAGDDYKMAYKENYNQYGDPKLADQYAKLQLSRTWAATTVNGTSQVMHYAPSIVFPGREQEFTDQLNASIRKDNPNTPYDDTFKEEAYQKIKAEGEGAAEGSFAADAYKQAQEERDLNKPKVKVGDKSYDWMIDSQDPYGNNVAQFSGRYPMYYKDDQGNKRPLMGPNGTQKVFTYHPGYTPEEAELLKQARENEDNIKQGYNSAQDHLNQWADNILKSPQSMSLTPAQRAVFKLQLRSSLRGSVQ